MRILKLVYMILVIAACFQPISWVTPFKRIIYNIYRLYVISMLYTFISLQFMDLILYVQNSYDFTNNSCIILPTFSVCCKISIMWINYDKMVSLITYLTNEPFKPMDSEEIEIRRKFDKTIRNNTLCYVILFETTCSSIALASLLTDFKQRRLLYRQWVPYDYSSYTIFSLTYAQQIMSTFHCATINVACDTLICGILMHICCQIETLQYRLRKISTNPDFLAYCIYHHNCILGFAQLVNVRFAQIIGFQFIVSALLICSILYQLTKSSFSANHIQLIMYMSCMLTQIFIYCWFGNKVKSKSLLLTDSIFQMDWSTLDNSVKKNLLIIMKRAALPIEFTTAHILNMNLDCFVALLKTSYSAYNLLVRV